jgi:hypothetical protein
MSDSARDQDDYTTLVDDMDAEIQMNPGNHGNIRLAYYREHKALRSKLRDDAEMSVSLLEDEVGNETTHEREIEEQQLMLFDVIDYEEEFERLRNRVQEKPDQEGNFWVYLYHGFWDKEHVRNWMRRDVFWGCKARLDEYDEKRRQRDEGIVAAGSHATANTSQVASLVSANHPKTDRQIHLEQSLETYKLADLATRDTIRQNILHLPSYDPDVKRTINALDAIDFSTACERWDHFIGTFFRCPELRPRIRIWLHRHLARKPAELEQANERLGWAEKRWVEEMEAACDQVDEEDLRKLVDWQTEHRQQYAGWTLYDRKGAYGTVVAWSVAYPLHSGFRALLKEWDGVNAREVKILYPYEYRPTTEQHRIRQILQNIAQDWRLLDVGEAFPIEFFVPKDVEQVATFFPELDPQDLRNWPMDLLLSIEQLARVSPGRCEEAIGHVRQCWEERLAAEEERMWDDLNWDEGSRLADWVTVGDVHAALRRYGVHQGGIGENLIAPPPPQKTASSSHRKTPGRSPYPSDVGYEIPSDARLGPVNPELLRNLGYELSPAATSPSENPASVKETRTNNTPAEGEEDSEESYEPPSASHEFVSSLDIELLARNLRSKNIPVEKEGKVVSSKSCRPAITTRPHPKSTATAERNSVSTRKTRSRHTPTEAEGEEGSHELPSANARPGRSSRSTRSKGSSEKRVNTTSVGVSSENRVSSEKRTSPEKTATQDAGLSKPISSKNTHTKFTGVKKPVYSKTSKPLRTSPRLSGSKRKLEKPSSTKNPGSTNAGVRKLVSAKKTSRTRTSPRSKRQATIEQGLQRVPSLSAEKSRSLEASSGKRVRHTAAPQASLAVTAAPQDHLLQAPASVAPQRRRKRKRRDWGDRTYQPNASARKKVKRSDDEDVARTEPEPVRKIRKIAKPKATKLHPSTSSSKPCKISSKENSSEHKLATPLPAARVRKLSLRDAFAEVSDGEESSDDSSDSDFVPSETSSSSGSQSSANSDDGDQSSDFDFVPSDSPSGSSGTSESGISEDELAVAVLVPRVAKGASARISAEVVDDDQNKAGQDFSEQEVVEQEVVEHAVVEQERQLEPEPEIQSDGETTAFFRHAFGGSGRGVEVGSRSKRDMDWTGTSRFPGVPPSGGR